jgi:hypothetical protein
MGKHRSFAADVGHELSHRGMKQKSNVIGKQEYDAIIENSQEANYRRERDSMISALHVETSMGFQLSSDSASYVKAKQEVNENASIYGLGNLGRAQRGGIKQQDSPNELGVSFFPADLLRNEQSPVHHKYLRANHGQQVFGSPYSPLSLAGSGSNLCPPPPAHQSNLHSPRHTSGGSLMQGLGHSGMAPLPAHLHPSMFSSGAGSGFGFTSGNSLASGLSHLHPSGLASGPVYMNASPNAYLAHGSGLSPGRNGRPPVQYLYHAFAAE